jgi:hypothetical protein
MQQSHIFKYLNKNMLHVRTIREISLMLSQSINRSTKLIISHNDTHSIMQDRLQDSDLRVSSLIVGAGARPVAEPAVW